MFQFQFHFFFWHYGYELIRRSLETSAYGRKVRQRKWHFRVRPCVALRIYTSTAADAEGGGDLGG
ncbi:hypothetical protein BGV04_20005 [Clostridioides difficile]|nr:hypothetical protein BGV04_20005 [Clostridioides difficile]